MFSNMKQEECMDYELFSSKSGRQKYTTWFPGDQRQAVFAM